MSTEAKNRYIGFWAYNSFTGVLWGEVTTFLPTGQVKIKEYGNGVFMPCLVLPLKEGKKLVEKLKKLEADYKRAQTLFEREWQDRKAALCPELVEKIDEEPQFHPLSLEANAFDSIGHRVNRLASDLTTLLKHHPHAEVEEIAEALDLDLGFDGVLRSKRS